MITVKVDKKQYRVTKCEPLIRYSYTRQSPIYEGIRLKVYELPRKYNPIPPSGKRADRIWGQQKPYIDPTGELHVAACDWWPSKLVYQGKKYDMYNEVEAELLYKKLSTDLALDSL